MDSSKQHKVDKNGKDILPKTEDTNSEQTPKPIIFEEILEKLGCFGPFQVLVLLCYFLLEIPGSFLVFIPILTGRVTKVPNCDNTSDIGTTVPDFLAYTPTTTGSEVDPTTTDPTLISDYLKSVFDGFQDIFESPFKYESVVDEWNLTCDRAWIPDVFTSCLMAGMIIGNIFASQMADWYGRRKTYLAIMAVMALGNAMSAFSPNIYFYALSRMISGAAFCGYMNVSCMVVLEFMTPKWRSVSNCVGPMGEGIMILSVLGYFIRPWRMLYLATMAPYFILAIPVYMFLPEGPRWLLRNNKVKEAHDVLNYMAKVNGKEPVSIEVLEALRKQEAIATESQNNKRISYCVFLKTRSLLVTTIYLFAIWFSWNVAYYGISYNIRNVEGDRYFNLGMIGLANAVGQRIAVPLCDWMGRRKAVLISMAFSASFLVTLAIFFLVKEQVDHYVILVGCLCGLLGMASCRVCARLLSGESYPTSVRTMGLALGILGANISGLVTPQLAYVGSRWPPLPYFVFAVIAVGGSLVVFMMKETNGNPLSDDVIVSDSSKNKSKV